MNRSDLLKTAPVVLLAACSAAVPGSSSILLPQKRGIQLPSGGCYGEYYPKFNFYEIGCSSGKYGRVAIYFDPKTGQFADVATLEMCPVGGRSCTTLSLDKGDSKWAIKKAFQLWKQYWYKPGDSGGTLMLKDGTPIMDAFFDPTPGHGKVTLTTYKDGKKDKQHTQGINGKDFMDMYGTTPLINKWGCAGASLGLLGSFITMACTEWTIVGAIGGAALVIGAACAVRGECF